MAASEDDSCWRRAFRTSGDVEFIFTSHNFQMTLLAVAQPHFQLWRSRELCCLIVNDIFVFTIDLSRTNMCQSSNSEILLPVRAVLVLRFDPCCIKDNRALVVPTTPCPDYLGADGHVFDW